MLTSIGSDVNKTMEQVMEARLQRLRQQLMTVDEGFTAAQRREAAPHVEVKGIDGGRSYQRGQLRGRGAASSHDRHTHAGTTRYVQRRRIENGRIGRL